MSADLIEYREKEVKYRKDLRDEPKPRTEVRNRQSTEEQYITKRAMKRC